MIGQTLSHVAIIVPQSYTCVTLIIFHLILILTQDYVKFELPPKQPITVSIGVDVKDIPKVFQNIHYIHYIWTKSKLHGFWLQVSDKDFSITLNAYFIVKWSDSRCREYDILYTYKRSVGILLSVLHWGETFSNK